VGFLAKSFLYNWSAGSSSLDVHNYHSPQKVRLLVTSCCSLGPLRGSKSFEVHGTDSWDRAINGNFYDVGKGEDKAQDIEEICRYGQLGNCAHKLSEGRVKMLCTSKKPMQTSIRSYKRHIRQISSKSSDAPKGENIKGTHTPESIVINKLICRR
jgi:hypothetical protein